MNAQTAVSRRTVLSSGGAVIAAPSFVSVVSGATDSGFVEVEADATLPTGTSISVRLNEDLDGDGSRENTQTWNLNDGTDTYEYDALDGAEGGGVQYWMEIELSANDDGSETPQLHSATITLPEEGAEEPSEEEDPAEDEEGIGELWDNFLVWTAVVVGLTGAIGMASRSMAVAMMGAFMTFALIAVSTGNALLENVLYVTLVLIFVGFAFKLWRLEGGGE